MQRKAKHDPMLTKQQLQAVQHAMCDLIGAMQAHVDASAHDWAGHMESIRELAKVFPDYLDDFDKEIETLAQSSWYADNITLGVLADGNTK